MKSVSKQLLLLLITLTLVLTTIGCEKKSSAQRRLEYIKKTPFPLQNLKRMADTNVIDLPNPKAFYHAYDLWENDTLDSEMVFISAELKVDDKGDQFIDIILLDEEGDVEGIYTHERYMDLKTTEVTVTETIYPIFTDNEEPLLAVSIPVAFRTELPEATEENTPFESDSETIMLPDAPSVIFNIALFDEAGNLSEKIRIKTDYFLPGALGKFLPK